jgi:hypothetical protein
VYADSSWADVVPSRKSSQCYLVFCNNAVFSWKATLASVLAMSTAEAELIALFTCVLISRIAAKLPMNLAFYEQPPNSHRSHSEEEGNANEKQRVKPNTIQRTALIPHNR